MQAYSSPLSSYGNAITYYGIIYTLTSRDLSQFSGVIAALRSHDDILYPAPAGSHHITLMGLTGVTSGDDASSTTFFDEHLGTYTERLKVVALATAPFDVHITKLQVGTQAIIARGADNGETTHIRDALADLPTLNAHTIDRGFIHTTLARYKREVALSEVNQRLQDISLTATLYIDKIDLIKASVSFAAPHEVIQTFYLTGNTS